MTLPFSEGFAAQSAGRAVVWVTAALLCLPAGRAATAAPMAVTTAHYDNGRTGWNPNERALTSAALASGQFEQLRSVSLGGMPAGQPLVVPNVFIAGDPAAGTHDVVFQATGANTLLAIDPTRGTVLLTRTFGARAPGPCDSGASLNEGIRSTPVIDPATRTIYAIVQEQVNGVVEFRLHALSLSTLADKVAPTVVAASQMLNDGSLYAFNAASEKQRPALLLSHGAVYAAFGAACENATSAIGRGWLLGWSASLLQPLWITRNAPVTLLADRDAIAPNMFFATSIWMMGAGVAADAAGSLYFVTGNSDPSGTTYDGVTNVPESAIKLSPQTALIQSLFTPAAIAKLEKNDLDFGSGGIMLLPSVGPGAAPLATAAGKTGIMYLMNRNNLGGFTPGGPDKVLAQARIGPCWCAESSFVTGQGTFVVSSGGTQIMLWQVTGTAQPGLTLVASSAALPSGQDGGMFTTVSSAGPDAPIIWTVTRPQLPDTSIYLYAFAASPAPGTTSLPQLLAIQAGTWRSNSNAPITPVVANGYVYVTDHNSLRIFGLGDADAAGSRRK